jgi:dihydroneopterin aldolase
MKRLSSATPAEGDRILVRKLEVSCIIGTYPHERTKKQSVFFDLEIPCDASRPARKDDLNEALDYDRLTRRVREFAADTRFLLIETLVENTAAMLLKEFRLPWVALTVWKPGALKDCRNLGISIVRKGKRR